MSFLFIFFRSLSFSFVKIFFLIILLYILSSLPAYVFVFMYTLIYIPWSWVPSFNSSIQFLMIVFFSTSLSLFLFSLYLFVSSIYLLRHHQYTLQLLLLLLGKPLAIVLTHTFIHSIEYTTRVKIKKGTRSAICKQHIYIDLYSYQ